MEILRTHKKFKYRGHNNFSSFFSLILQKPFCINSKLLASSSFLLNWSRYTYSRVHKSSDSFFSKILEKPSIVQKKMIPHIKGLDFSQRWSKKKNQNGQLKKNEFFNSANSLFIFKCHNFSIWQFMIISGHIFANYLHEYLSQNLLPSL